MLGSPQPTLAFNIPTMTMLPASETIFVQPPVPQIHEIQPQNPPLTSLQAPHESQKAHLMSRTFPLHRQLAGCLRSVRLGYFG